MTSRKFESARKLRRLPLKRRKTRKTKCCPPPYTGYAPRYLQQCYHLGALTETQRPASWPRCSPERSAKKPAVARPKTPRTRDGSCNPTRLTRINYVHVHQFTWTYSNPKSANAKTAASESKTSSGLECYEVMGARKIKPPQASTTTANEKENSSAAAPSGQDIIHYRKQRDRQSPRRCGQHSTRFPEGSQHHARRDARPQADHVQRSQHRCQH